MSYKKWCLTILAVVLLPVAAVTAVNFYIDPFWCFSHSNGLNRLQKDFDERQQKTNEITFSDFYYNALMLGSSRTAFMDQNDFKGMRAFNYSVNSMLPSEYADYVDYARKRNGRPFDYIIIGLDFYGSNRNFKKTFKAPRAYFEKANGFLYRYLELASLDTLYRSYVNVANLSNDYGYDRRNIKVMLPMNPEKRKGEIAYQLNYYEKECYGEGYAYTDGLKETFVELMARNPSTRFIVFTTPVSKPLFELMVRMGRYEDYERWIRDATSSFGGVYNFMYINSITVDAGRYRDLHHFTPAVGAMIAGIVTGEPVYGTPSDFGVLVTKDNLEEHLGRVREQAEEILQRARPPR